jgi:serine/threonine protein kinase
MPPPAGSGPVLTLDLSLVAGADLVDAVEQYSPPVHRIATHFATGRDAAIPLQRTHHGAFCPCGRCDRSAPPGSRSRFRVRPAARRCGRVGSLPGPGEGLDRPVAIKLLRRVRSMDEISRKRFLREARVAAKIHPPEGVAIHRVGKFASHGQPYLVMEYMDGNTFEDVLAGNGPVPEAEAVTRLTAAGQDLGDAVHAPPEQLMGETIRPGSDIYAVAVTAYELLTGGAAPRAHCHRPAHRIRSPAASWQCAATAAATR